MRNPTLALLALATFTTGSPAAADESAPGRLAPLYRHSILVSDLERSLTLYRDILGLEVSRVTETSPDSYSYVFFNIPPGSMKRFAYLDGEGGRRNVLGIGEVPGLELNLPESPRSVAWVQTVADVEGVMAEAQALGLTLIPPLEFMSREAGRTGIETGVIDFDGHLVMFYGLKRDPEGDD
ncbi:MAG: VOC family protein [Pseudomonadota bacterium]